jgi:predicted nuclease of predicted toxin-antitoxin system
MRFLIDENVKVKLLHWLSQNGHDAVRVPTGTKNGKIIALGIAESRMLVTHDHDFADRLRYPPAKHAGVVLLAIHPPVLKKLMEAMQNLISNPPTEGFSARLIILREKGYHILT